MAGPAPTLPEIWTQAGKYVALWEHWDNIHNASSPNTLDVYAAATNAGIGEGVYTPAAVGMIGADVASVSAPLGRDALKARWRPFLREIVRLSTGDSPSPSLADASLLEIVRKYMVDNSKTIKTRTLTQNAPTVTSATGDGQILRLSTDKDGFTMEAANAETLTFECEQDQNSGAKEAAEVFRVTGLTPNQVGFPNALEWTGSNIDTTIVSAHAKTASIIRNPSFDTNAVTSSGSALSATTDVTNWVVATAANWKAYSTSAYVYRGYPGAPTTKWGLECIADDTITQTILTANKGARFGTKVPYFVRVAWQRKTTATGNLTIALGSQSSTVTIGSGTADVWNHLYIALGTKNYFDNFNQASLALVITVDTLAAGTVVIDDVVVAPMKLIGGSWYVVDGGDTAWLKGDKWTSTTTEGTRGKFGYWLWRAFGGIGWLPAVGTGAQVTASGGRTLTFADADPDTITASSGSFITDGYEVGMTVTVAGTSSNNGTYVIASVTATVITLITGDALAAEGPLSATATLDGAPSEADPA